MKIRLIWNYNPPVRRRFYSRHANGVTFRLWRFGLHIWTPPAYIVAEHAAFERNKRVADRYEELMREGKHGHYETLFRVVREEVDRARWA